MNESVPQKELNPVPPSFGIQFVVRSLTKMRVINILHCSILSNKILY
jgi:hypothetical protein